MHKIKKKVRVNHLDKRKIFANIIRYDDRHSITIMEEYRLYRNYHRRKGSRIVDRIYYELSVV